MRLWKSVGTSGLRRAPRPGSYCIVALGVWLAAGVSTPSTCAAETPAEPFERGRIVEPVACRTDSTQTYALYLPSTYDSTTTWPALLIFDPRGRSVVSAEIFREAAETYGWILLSSNDTRSDGPWEPNARALDALWPEVQTRFPVDTRRIYAAGFSGGVLVAWYLAQFAEPPALAGILSAGGRPAREIPTDSIAFAHFGATGHLDFNYLAMRTLDKIVETRGAPHQLRVFEGRHAWMPAELATEGVEWMEIIAMQRGLRTRDARLVETLFQKNLRHARELREAGRVLEAQRHLQMMADTWSGLRSTASVVRTLSELEVDPRLREQRDEELRADRFEVRTQDRLEPALQALSAATGPTSVVHYRTELGLEELQARAAEDSPSGLAARRVLEWLYTRTSFYITRDLLAQERYAHAATASRLALEIHPERPRAWYNLARAQALDGRTQAAVDALQRALDTGFRNLARLESDPSLESIRKTAGYEDAVQRLRSGPSHAPR